MAEEVEMRTIARMNNDGFDDRVEIILELMEDDNIPDGWIDREAASLPAEHRDKRQLNMRERIAYFYADSELLWDNFKDKFVSRFPERKGNWPPVDLCPTWAGNELRREQAKHPGGSCCGWCWLGDPRVSNKGVGQGVGSVLWWKLKLYCSPILGIVNSKHAGRASITRVVSLIAVVICLSALMGLLYGYAFPRLDQCSDYVEAQCEVLSYSVIGYIGPGLTGLGYIAMNVGSFCERGDGGVCVDLNGDAFAVHQCGPALNVLIHAPGDWLDPRNITFPSTTPCWVSSHKRPSALTDGMTISDGDIVIDSSTVTLSLESWFFIVLGLICTPLFAGALCLFKPVLFDVFYPCCGETLTDSLWGDKDDHPCDCSADPETELP